MARRTILVGLAVLMMALALPATGVAGVALADQHDQACEYPVTVTDGTGAEVELEERPERIVTTHASTAQVADELGIWDRVVGAPVQPFTAYIDGYDEPADVTDDEGFPVVEEIVDLDPDLVLVGHVGDEETVQTLRDNGLTVYMHETPGDVDEIMTKVQTIGLLTGECDTADATVEWMNERLDHAETLSGEERPLVYYELGDGWTTGDGTFQHDMIERAGGENLGAAANVTGWAPVAEEVVVDLDPDWIIYGDFQDEPPVADAIEETTAIREGQTLGVDTNFVNQAGPKVVLVIEAMAEAIHAEAPADDAVADDAPEEDPPDDTEEVIVDDDDEAVDDAADDTIPGFGVAAAAAAIVVALLARRV